MISCFFREFVPDGVKQQLKFLPSFKSRHIDKDGKKGLYPLADYFLDMFGKGPGTILAAGGIATSLAERFLRRGLPSAKCVVFSPEVR